MRLLPKSAGFRSILSAAAISLLSLAIACGGSTSTSSSSSGGGITSTNPYAAAYMAIANWGTGVTVSFPSNCSMTVSSTGVPPFHNAYYLAPAGVGQTVVATTPSGIQLAVTPYAGGGISTVNKVSATFNICPAKAASTTSASLGAIGFISSGEVLFNAYEATNTVAMGDNVSYTPPGGAYTAYFIDQCNSHAAGGMGANSGSTWHYHANPVCWTATVDGAAGPSHIIGIALDGYPVYGGRDINGNVVAASSLDACNGITSPTPEFPSGAYHYVLPLNTTTAQSSIGCYTGTVGTSIMAWSQQLKCKMLMAMQRDNGGPPKWVPALPPVPGSVAARNLAARKMAMPGMDMPAIAAANMAATGAKRMAATGAKPPPGI